MIRSTMTEARKHMDVEIGDGLKTFNRIQMLNWAWVHESEVDGSWV